LHIDAEVDNDNCISPTFNEEKKSSDYDLSHALIKQNMSPNRVDSKEQKLQVVEIKSESLKVKDSPKISLKSSELKNENMEGLMTP